ncbi:beta-ketoacyl synthase N-terminal-like domain-containing protein [Spirillospora sp. NPDC050679]
MNAACPPVAVVGLGVLLPGAADARTYWRMILSRGDQLTEVPATRWLTADHYDPDPAAADRTYARRGGFLAPVDFAPLDFGIPPTALPATDASQLLALMAAEQVLTAVGTDGLDREKASVILGGSGYLPLATHMAGRQHRPMWRKALREHGLPEAEAQAICDRISAEFVPWQEATFPGLLPNVVAGRIANRFDLHGTNHTTDAACASSLAAVTAAVGELMLGRSDLVVTGGFDTLTDELSYLCFSKTPALSPTGDCRPFSADGDGTMLGEGVVMLALKRLADAERDGDHVYAVVRGIGTSSDGRSKAIYAPVSAGQERALRRAYAEAGYGPETVELVEAHGTGTRAGDAAEFAALRAVFGASGRPDRQWCALGSVKSQIGHTKGAAGAASLAKAVLALHHKVLPPTIKVDRPHPDLDLESSPFYLNTETRPWGGSPEHPRRASVSSFGFGGSNFHMTLEEHQAPAGVSPAPPLRAAATELLLVSARSEEELLNGIAELKAQAADGTPEPHLARASQSAFDIAAPHRLAVPVTDDAVARLDRATEMVGRNSERPFASAGGICRAAGPAGPGKVALLFPGQGAQYLGMGGELAARLPVARRAWERAASHRFGTVPLHRVMLPPPVFDVASRDRQYAELTATEWAQPAIAAHSLALLAVLDELGLRPDFVAGHSFGELIALHAAGAYDADTLLALARRRGELMREAAAEPGGMLAVAASADATARLLEGSGITRAWVANENAPDQTVVAGTDAALTAFTERCAEQGLAAKLLPTSTAFHSPLVAQACEPFAEFLDGVPMSPPHTPVYGNADAAPYPGDPKQIRQRISAHPASPVRFAAQIEAMYEAGARVFVEAGPSGPLTGLVGRILGDRPHLAVALDRAGVDATTVLFSALGRLAVHGVPLDWNAHWQEYGSFPARKAASKLTVPIDGGNLGRPYPPGNATTVPPRPVPAPRRTSAAPSDDHSDTAQGDPMDAQRHARDDRHHMTTQAHQEFQRLLTEAHLAYLRLGGDAGPQSAPARHEPAAWSLPQAEAPQRPAGPPEPRRHDDPAWEAQPVPERPDPVPSDAAPAPSEGSDVESVLLEVVADRTGYPVEMLDSDMELEADLGIDSIKRVEILSGLRKRLGDLDAPTEELAALRTLGEITDLLRRRLPDGPAGAAAAPKEPGRPTS